VKRALVVAACAVALGGVATQSGSSSPGSHGTRAARRTAGRNLYAGNTFGYWVRVAGDRAVALDQQYQP
jgi:hypothetical protein